MTRRRRSPRTLGLALDRVRDELAPQTVLAEVQRVWTDAVGDAIAGDAQPTAERGGTLTVSCSAAVWAQELDLMAPAILDRLNQRLGTGRIERLRCVTLPV
jgi:predicted nucleic acid-binding Zn ribbon protein